jgi:hypothetical protein
MAAKPRLTRRQELRDALILPTRVLVHVFRDMAETIATVCFEHEVDILAEIHGEGNVNVVADPMQFNMMIASPGLLAKGREEMIKAASERRKVPAFSFVDIHPSRTDSEGKYHLAPVYTGEEMERLKAVYGMHAEKKEFNVLVVYPTEADLVDACGGVFQPEKANAA